jgi:hypothetical protein
MCKRNDDDTPAPRHWPPPSDGDYQPGPWGSLFAPVALALALIGCGGSGDGDPKPGPARRFRDFMNEPIDDARTPRNGPRPAPPFHWAAPVACSGDDSDDVGRPRPPGSKPASDRGGVNGTPAGRPPFRVRSRGTHGPWAFNRWPGLRRRPVPAGA